MTKEEKTQIFDFDSLSLILFAVVAIFAIFRLIFPDLLPEIVMQITFAIAALIASFLYFQRVRSLSVSYNTPFSDTLVILAGFYLMLVLLTPIIDQQPPAIIWSLVLIIIGIMGRLILLDSIIKSIFTGIKQIFITVFGWLRGPYNLLRFILFFGGLFLVLGSYFEVFLLSVLIGYIMMSIAVLLSLRTNQEQNFFMQLVGALLVVFLVFNAFVNTSNREIMFFDTCSFIYSLDIW